MAHVKPAAQVTAIENCPAIFKLIDFFGDYSAQFASLQRIKTKAALPVNPL
jgi:hypothetical protein